LNLYPKKLTIEENNVNVVMKHVNERQLGERSVRREEG